MKKVLISIFFATFFLLPLLGANKTFAQDCGQVFAGVGCPSPNVACPVPGVEDTYLCCKSQSACTQKQNELRASQTKPANAKPSNDSFSTTIRSVDFFSETLWNKQFSASSGGTIGSLVQRLLTYAFTAAGVLLLIYLIVSGFKMFTSGGDQKKVAEAKASLTNAAIGFVVVFIAFWIVQLAGSIFGLGSNTVFQGLFK